MGDPANDLPIGKVTCPKCHEQATKNVETNQPCCWRCGWDSTEDEETVLREGEFYRLPDGYLFLGVTDVGLYLGRNANNWPFFKIADGRLVSVKRDDKFFSEVSK
jgi:hypothetical protein